jgi:hypothetical protein
MTGAKEVLQPRIAKEKAAPRTSTYVAPLSWNKTARRRLLVVLGLDHFTTTVEAVRADVVTQVGFAGGRLDGQFGATRKSCERCMPRFDGDFLFC